MSRPFGGTTGRRSYAAAFALLAVVVVLAYAAYRPSSRREAVRWARVKVLRSCEKDPAGCVRHQLDDDWDAGSKSAAPAPASADAKLGPSKDQIMADEESFVLNQVAAGGVGRVPTYASRSSVLAQRQLLERLFQHDMGLPEERLRRSVSYAGDPERLHRVLHKLIRGDAITVSTVGGSVTAGVGAATIDLSYRERLFYWIRTVFPNQNHTFHNGALAAAPSSYMSQCIHDFAPPHSDLVFVEFTMNDGQKTCDVTTDGRRGFEVLLRKVLNYQSAPAVVILHWWSPVTQDFWVSPEDQLDVFGKYYGLPSLSWRDTVHDLIAHNVTGFKVSDLYADKGHPNGYNGHRYFADMIIGLLRNEAASVILRGLDVSAEPAAPTDMARVPEPMLEGNHEGKSTCLRNEQLQDAVVETQGFEWKDEGKNGRHKWGYVSWHPGDKILLKANTKTYRGDSKVLIGVGILRSYEHMGTAELTCVSGCECESMLMDGQWESRTSQSEWQYVAVSQHEECVIAVHNTNGTSSGEHKVKVDSFLVTNLHESAQRWFSHIDELEEKHQRELRRKAAEEAKQQEQQQKQQQGQNQEQQEQQPPPLQQNQEQLEQEEQSRAFREQEEQRMAAAAEQSANSSSSGDGADQHQQGSGDSAAADSKQQQAESSSPDGDQQKQKQQGEGGSAAKET